MSATRYLWGLFALALFVFPGAAKAGGLVLVDLWPEWHTRAMPCIHAPGGKICPGEDGRELPEASEHGGIILVDLWPEWTSPREAEPFTVADLFHAWGMYDTEDGADDPTPTLDDPTERDGFVEHNPLGTEYRAAALIEVPPLVWVEPAEAPTPEPTASDTPTAAPTEPTPPLCPPGQTPVLGGLFCLGYWTPGGDWRIDWSTEPDLKDACPVVEVIDQPVSVETPDGGSAAYFGGCVVTECPNAEPVTTCCTSSPIVGEPLCEELSDSAEVTPYEPPGNIWTALEWLFTLPGSGEVPAGHEGPWRYYLYTNAGEGR